MKEFAKNSFFLAAAVCVLLAVVLVSSVQERGAALAERIVRMHVVAASDEPAEQAVKLEVRDAVSDLLTPRLSLCRDMAEAERAVAESLGEIEAEARRVYGGEVSVSLCREELPTREYDTFSLPAGEYETLRITLGAGEGHNWWCVVFPPICSAGSEEQVLAYLGKKDAAFVTGEGVVIRFRIAEWLSKLAPRRGRRA